MYAILKHGGHQYRVAAGDRLLIDRLAAEVGSQVTLEPVLLVADGDSAEVGAGTVPGARIVATVVAHRRGRKLRVFTYKPKKRHRRTLGYRSQLTELLIDEVAGGSLGSAKRRTETPAAEAEARPEPEAEAPRRSRRPRAEATAEPASAAPASDENATAGAEAEPEPAPKPKADASAKRAGRPRRKPDGA